MIITAQYQHHIIEKNYSYYIIAGHLPDNSGRSGKIEIEIEKSKIKKKLWVSLIGLHQPET